jgi:hypothetical protein
LVLYVFGENYAKESTSLLRWLIVATIPFMINNWYLGYSRVLSNVKAIILVQSLQFVITLGASYFWLPMFGITGIGMAWFLAHCIITLYVIAKVAPMFWNKQAKP